MLVFNSVPIIKLYLDQIKAINLITYSKIHLINLKFMIVVLSN